MHGGRGPEGKCRGLRTMKQNGGASGHYADRRTACRDKTRWSADQIVGRSQRVVEPTDDRRAVRECRGLQTRSKVGAGGQYDRRTADGP